ncbi:MAG TPA: recombinase family protein [Daejeonella sp.]
MDEHEKMEGMELKRAVTYYRVSTEKQGKSGLGLDAQKVLVKDFARSNGFILRREFVEVESGKKALNRPILRQALAFCKQEKAILLIAKLDRLSRNVAFISALMESGVEFKAVDNPHASRLVLHIMAAFAEHERDQISERTKAALSAAKLRGVELGKNGKYTLSRVNKIKSRLFAEKMMPYIELLKFRGIRTMRDIADELNRLNIPTFRSAKWHPTSVYRIIKQIETIK